MAAKSPNEIPGSFGHSDIGFVSDKGLVDASIPNATNATYEDFGETLLASGNLPPLGTAPVSAWALARLAALSGRRFPLHSGQVCGSDGDDYWLHFLSFSTTGDVRVAGKLAVAGSRTGVRLYVQAAPPHSPDQLRDAFSATLLTNPTELRSITIVVVYTSLEDENHWKHAPYTLGWDGSGFVFHDSPEHTISAEDYE